MAENRPHTKWTVPCNSIDRRSHDPWFAQVVEDRSDRAGAMKERSPSDYPSWIGTGTAPTLEAVVVKPQTGPFTVREELGSVTATYHS